MSKGSLFGTGVVVLVWAGWMPACSDELEPQAPRELGDEGFGDTDAGLLVLGQRDGEVQAASDLSCEIDGFLAQHCRACHGVKLLAGAPMSLLDHADLLAASPTDVTKTNAQRSLEMVQAATMPPGGGLASADQQAFAAWVQAGAPVGSCGVAADAGTNPYDTPVVCTSNRRWTGGDRESPLMHPGRACISCHQADEGPRFSIAGTVSPTAHEPDECNGAASSAISVIITDANGVEHGLTPNAAGNFFFKGALAKPYRAKVVYEGRTRAMVSAQSNGDCNTCHTEAGASGAPGRVMLP